MPEEIVNHDRTIRAIPLRELFRPTSHRPVDKPWQNFSISKFGRYNSLAHCSLARNCVPQQNFFCIFLLEITKTTSVLRVKRQIWWKHWDKYTVKSVFFSFPAVWRGYLVKVQWASEIWQNLAARNSSRSVAARIEQLRYNISSAKCGNFTWMCTTTDPSQNTIINNNVYILHCDYIFIKHQQEQKKYVPIHIYALFCTLFTQSRKQ